MYLKRVQGKLLIWRWLVGRTWLVNGCGFYIISRLGISLCGFGLLDSINPEGNPNKTIANKIFLIISGI